MTNVQTARSARPDNGVAGRFRLVRAWIGAVGSALGLVSIVYVASMGLGVTLSARSGAGGFSEVTFGQIFGMTLLGSSIGLAVAYATRRWVPKPRLTFVAITALALVGYGAVPFMAAETMATALWLNLFHLVVAVPVIWMLALALPITAAEAS